MIEPAPAKLSVLQRLGTGDATGLLSVYIATLIVIPSGLIFSPLGGAGAPAQIIGMCLFAWWTLTRYRSSRDPAKTRQPVRIAMLIFGAAVMLSYLAAASRPLLSEEKNAADRGILLFCSWLGIMLVAMDAIPTRERLDTLLRRLTSLAGALAGLGVVQFITGQAWTNYIVIPGLVSNSALVGISARDGLNRPSGTALHPIEFGAVLTMCLPIALHYALQDKHRPTLRRWLPVAAIAVAVPISISRSAIVSTIVVLCFLVPSWPPQLRRRAYGAMLALPAFLFLSVPGLLGTLAGLFTGISSDSSAQSRTGSFPLAFEFIGRAPIFGRGFQTFLPSFWILDDQYLGTLIETGIVGLLALLGLFLTGVLSARHIRRRTDDATDRSLAQSLAAAVASALASFALFDAFSFPMCAGLIFFILGSVAALNRLVPPPPSATNRSQIARRAYRSA